MTVAAPAGGDDPGVAMTREQVVELARVDVDRNADRIDRIYGWRVERLLMTLRATLVVAGSILGAWPAAVFARAEQPAMWQVAIAAAGLVGSFSGVIYQNARLDRLYDNYLESLRLLAVVEGLRERDEWIRTRSS